MQEEYKSKYLGFLRVFLLFFTLLIPHKNLSASDNKLPLIEVTGAGFIDIVKYPEKGITSKVIFDVMAQSRKRFPAKMTIEDLNSVADELTDLYRSKGFKFHTVYLPPQKTKKGFIHFKVTEAILGDIQVIGKNIDKKAIKSVFANFLKKPLYQPDIDDAVLALKNQRAIDAVAYYSRGAKPGEVRLNIKAQQIPWQAYMQVDNFGSESTGEYRLTGGFTWYSHTARFDELSFGVMAANGDPDANIFGYLNYKMPLWNLDNQLSVNLSNNVFSIGQDFNTLALDGDARIAQVKFDHQVNRSWHSKSNLAFTLAHKSTDYDSAFNDPDIERDETSESLAVEWDYNRQTRGGVFHQQWNFSVTGGRYEIDGFTTEKETFSKVNVSAKFRVFFSSDESRWANTVNLLLRGQHTEAPLPSFEKFLLTGAYGVRSSKPGYFAGERGGFASLDWYFTRLFSFESNSNVSLVPWLFVDVAHGKKLALDESIYDSATLSGAGVGLEFSMNKNWTARLFLSQEIRQKTDSGLLLDSQTFFFQMNYRIQ